MKQIIILMVLALGMCSISGSAQTRRTNTQQKKPSPIVPQETREYQVGDDGFEWYKICKNGKYGAEDKNGTIIIPLEYDNVIYISYNKHNDGDAHGNYFLARKGDYQSCYTSKGVCVIPYTRHYCRIGKNHSSIFGTYYICYIFKPNAKTGTVFCNVDGKEVCAIDKESNMDLQYYDAELKHIGGKFFFEISTVYGNSEKNGRGIADINGKIIVEPKYKWISFNEEKNAFVDDNGIVVGYLHSINTYTNPLANNVREDISQNHMGSINGSSSSNSGGGTTTVVVEHHRDPIPVQEWQQCPACNGSGQCPNVQCGGSGWYYIGDRRTICSRCNGSGKCTICAGRGGQNITVYR